MQKNKMTASPAQRMRLDTGENPFRNENIIRAPVVYAENDSFVEYDLHPNDEGEAEDKEQRARDMQAWWEDSITKHMRKSTGYLEVAVLLINWAPELDELKTKSEVSQQDTNKGTDPGLTALRWKNFNRSFATASGTMSKPWNST
jgi:hypothetical protein